MSNKLVETIKALVRSEVKKAIKPAINEALSSFLHEEVENRVNAILAEKFIRNVSLVEDKQVEAPKQTIAKQKSAPVPRRVNTGRFSYLKESEATPADKMLNHIYSDIGEEDVAMASMADEEGGDATFDF